MVVTRFQQIISKYSMIDRIGIFDKLFQPVTRDKSEASEL